MLVIIPARYQSSRFPGKPLAILAGKPVIEHVYNKTVEAAGKGNVYVATDDERIYDVVTGFGGKAIMTSPECANGTERCREAYINSGWKDDIIINVQGDEPMIDPKQILAIASLLESEDNDIATLVRKADENDNIFDPSVVKVVRGVNGEALYFSRAAIPFQRDIPKENWQSSADYFLHVGMYGFKSEVLKKITTLKASPLEKLEKLEQLRWLQNGYKIATALTDVKTVGIDTPEDLAEANRLMNN